MLDPQAAAGIAVSAARSRRPARRVRRTRRNSPRRPRGGAFTGASWLAVRGLIKVSWVHADYAGESLAILSPGWD